MRFLDLNGKSHIFNFTKNCRENSVPSGLHIKARKLIQTAFPSSSIYEEVNLLGTGLIIDFFIPDLLIGLEVHGEQHYKFVKRFHKTVGGFVASQKRDRMKQEWCEINDVIYVELPFNKIDEWRSIVKGAL